MKQGSTQEIPGDFSSDAGGSVKPS